jgi:hypothetical protein
MSKTLTTFVGANAFRRRAAYDTIPPQAGQCSVGAVDFRLDRGNNVVSLRFEKSQYCRTSNTRIGKC